MKQIALDVDTLRCEADEADVLDELLAHHGVLAAEIDFPNERVHIAYDEAVVTKGELLGHLRFFGLDAKTSALALNA